MKNVAVILVACSLFALSFTLPNNEPVKKSDNKEKLADSGIEFQSMSFADALAKAKTENKLIFVDIYTSWCGPCKLMTKNVFPDAALGKYFNENFINLKLDAEKSEDGKKVAKDYGVNAYPTLLFIDGEGKMVKKHIGYIVADQLLKIAQGLK